MKKHLLNTFIFCFLMAFVASAQIQLVSDFTFTDNLDDAEGNGTMTILNGANYSYSNGMFTNGIDSTGAAPGLKVTLPDALFDEMEYTIQIDFSFAQTSGYRKVLDYNLLAVDAGLYINDQLRLYSAGNYGPTAIAIDSMVSVLVVRNNALDSAWVYLTDGINRQLESAAQDAANYFAAALEGSNRVLHFFHDDSLTGSEFANSFTVDRIRIWNGNLPDVAGLKQPTTASFTCFPNPAGSTATIQFNAPVNGEVEILTTTGRLISAQTVSNQTALTVSLEQFQTGMYLIRYNNEVVRLLKK